MPVYSLICAITRGDRLVAANTATIMFDAEDDAEAVLIALQSYATVVESFDVVEVYGPDGERVWEKPYAATHPL